MNKSDIKILRKKANMSLSQFAEYFDIPLSTIHNWEQGLSSPPVYVYKMIENILKKDKKIT